MNTHTIRLALLGVAFGILLALLLAPQTRWLVRMPFRLLPALPGQDSAVRQKIVQAHPADFQIQLAGQPSASAQTPLEYDRSLVSRFPGSASLRAKILRDATTKEVRLHRDEDNLLQGKPAAVFRPGPNDPVPTAAQLAAFDADAAAGERLDPGNAYFPFMRAVGLFAAHRDADGLAAVQRASAKNIWNEYLSDEVEGRWRISQEIYGGQEALAAAAVSAGVLFPEYTQLRAAARVVVYQAVLDEQAGHREAGLAKREALARCGELISVQATSIIGILVGAAINMVSRDRPGGVPPAAPDTHLTGSQRAQRSLEAFCTYVNKIGHPEAAAEARADDQSWQQIHRVTEKLNDNYINGSLSSLVRAGIAFYLGVILLPNILSLFVLGLIAAWLFRLPRMERREPLSAGAAAGLWGMALIGVLLCGLLASWQAATLVWLALYCAVPLLLFFIWSIVALVKHVPFSVKVVENFRAVMPPLVFALMLVYGGLTLWTVRQEARVNYGLERSLHGEGQYLAQMTGLAWPKE